MRSPKREKRLLRTAATAYRKLAALNAYCDTFKRRPESVLRSHLVVLKEKALPALQEASAAASLEAVHFPESDGDLAREPRPGGIPHGRGAHVWRAADDAWRADTGH